MDGPPAAPRISIVTAVMDDRAGIGATLESVRAQTFGSVEHVVVDGGSRDGTVELLREAERPGFVWSSERDGGIADAFNRGIARSRGDFICFLNSGDRLAAPTTLAMVAPFLDGASIAVGRASMAGRPLGRARRRGRGGRLVTRTGIVHQAAFVARRVFEERGGFDPRFKLRMDYEFWLRVLPHHDVVSIGEVVVDIARWGASARNPRLFDDEAVAANRLHLRNPLIENLRVRLRPWWHRLLKRAGMFDWYRR